LSGAAGASQLSSSEIEKRNTAVDRLLADSGFTALNVLGDGNCYFRAVSVNLHKTEDEHLNLRKSIVNHVFQLAESGKTLPGISMDISDASVCKQLNSLGKAGTWAGEEMIMATADYLRRPVHIFTFSSVANSSPLEYTAPQCDTSLPPVRLAFYFPGHYKAVLGLSSQPTLTCSSKALNLNA
jgi:hypothetical protein